MILRDTYGYITQHMMIWLIPHINHLVFVINYVCNENNHGEKGISVIVCTSFDVF